MSKGSGVKGRTVPHLARAMAAAKRKERREARTPQEQLVALDARPGASSKERRRLLAAIAAGRAA